MITGKVVVFGGSGFLGSYVVDELISRGFSVINADVVPPKYNINVQSFKKVDIRNITDIEQVISSEVDYVYNFAGLADIDDAFNNPQKSVDLNVIGNINILEVCKKFSIKRFVYASIAYACSNKGSFYGISKLASEKFVEEYQLRYGLNYTIVRYGSLYGERADERNGIYRLLKQAIEAKKIVHRGDGEEVREYIHCRDAARLSIDILADQYLNKHLLLTGIEKLKYKDLLAML